ncbi:MAG: c-type cytochrome [Gammaproteobacteria bacterium]|nr:cytochrome c4 [Pseudomonadales bacterium]
MKKSVTLVSWLISLAALSAVQIANAQGDAAAGAGKVALCATCHGSGGNSQISMNPSLAGQNANYIVKQLQDYQSGERQNPTMSAMVGSLSGQDIEDIAAYYASQERRIVGAQDDQETLALGEALYRAGNSEIGSAACTACHAPTGKGNAPAGFPAIGGQHSEYTLTQLRAFRASERANDLNGMMRTVVERLTDAELEALANYVAGLH